MLCLSNSPNRLTFRLHQTSQCFRKRTHRCRKIAGPGLTQRIAIPNRLFLQCVHAQKFSSVQSLDRLGCAVDVADDSVEIFFQSVLQEAIFSSSLTGTDVHSLMLSIQHFQRRPRCRPPPKCPEGWFERLSWRVACPNHASFHLLTVARRRLYEQEVDLDLRSLYWLRVSKSTNPLYKEYKILCLTYQSEHKTAPQYLQEPVSHFNPLRSLRSPSLC